MLKGLYKIITGKKTENRLLEDGVIKNTILLARAPLGTPKVPLYRTPESKRQSFTVIKGEKE